MCGLGADRDMRHGVLRRRFPSLAFWGIPVKFSPNIRTQKTSTAEVGGRDEAQPLAPSWQCKYEPCGAS